MDGRRQVTLAARGEGVDRHQWPGMVEAGASPGSRVGADLAVGGETSSLVIGVGGPTVLVEVAVHTSGADAAEIEQSTLPAKDRVAALAGQRQAASSHKP